MNYTFKAGSRCWVPITNANANFLIRSFNVNAKKTNIYSNYYTKSIKSRKFSNYELINRLESEYGEFSPTVYGDGEVHCPGHEVLEQS